MRVLVTRPSDDAAEIAAALQARGHQAVVAPLLALRFHDGAELDLAGVQAILATSANGVRALARRTARRDIPVFAVGPQTEDAARRAGFAAVQSADGDAAALAAAIPAWARPDRGALLHASGADGEGRLARALTGAGYAVRTEVLYAVEAVGELPQVAREALKAGALDAVLLFSPRSAQIFAGCVAQAGLAGACARLSAMCISEAAAKGLAPLAFAQIRVAARPNQASLLDCLG
ncbi:MAG TPA: uroporphyrinogen-III synthase [Rhizomicrobium sp.]|jgi:uroporphyrinogen-III synthase|nr:uroporphyrinogen-III synthase [Rhizomicrobium sp.]